MEVKRLSLKTKKVSVRKDLFGTHNAEAETNDATVENGQSPLKSIWGESSSSAFTKPTSNSVLLSPALKRSPNRFSTSPSSQKSPGTPKKSSSPRKLSKYSPFRKKVYNPSPKGSIKNFFTVKERSPSQNDPNQTHLTSFGIKRLSNDGASTSVSNSNPSSSSQDCDSGKVLSQEGKSQEDIRLSTTTPTKTNEEINKITPNSTPKNTPKTTPVKSSPQSASKNLSPTSKITGSKDVYGSFLLRISVDMMINETDPDGVRLFSEQEYAHITAFNQFDQPSQRLYGRLLNRKLDWIRTATMKYGDVNMQLILLEQNGFITSDCGNESLETLLNLLTLPDLRKLCKTYKLSEGGVKADVISRLISRAKQPSIKSFFGQTSSDNLAEKNLRMQIYELLGVVVKVTNGPQQTFSRCLLFFSYPHFRGLERDRFSDQLALVSQLHNLTFPSFEIIRTKVFHSREHFFIYEDALREASSLLEAKEDKNWDLVLEKLRQIVKKLRSYLNSEEIRREIEAMPDFLRSFTAGGCYVRALSSSVEVFKKWEHSLGEAEAGLELLLGQRLFSRHRRGQWFKQLALLYQYNLKDNVKACETVLRGLRDEYIDVISRHTLCARATMLEGRKKNELKDCWKDSLAAQRAQVEALDDPPNITITEQILNSGRKGLKQVYIQDSGDGKMLSSVEEVAREHFRQQGFTHGGHDEGGIIKSVVFACFWDEIYGETMIDGHGLFHSEYQTVPLDWNSETFYDKRRETLKSKLQDLAEEGIDAVVGLFQQCYVNCFGKESVVNWKYLEHYDTAESLIRCIDIDVFLNLSRLLLRQHRIYGAGFPDLTLWDPIEKKCVFVEVKSPNDTLSMKQKVWIHSLNRMGANALVCHVKSVGCKSQKRKANSTEETGDD